MTDSDAAHVQVPVDLHEQCGPLGIPPVLNWAPAVPPSPPLYNQLVGILLTQTGMSTPDSARAMQDFWTTLYQAIDG